MSSEPEKKMRSWESDITSYNKFKSIISGHGGDVGETINELIRNYNKEHGDGNPTYKITDFQDENFLATPALSREPKVIKKYLESIYGTSEWDKIGNLIQMHWVNQFNDVETSHI